MSTPMKGVVSVTLTINASMPVKAEFREADCDVTIETFGQPHILKSSHLFPTCYSPEEEAELVRKLGPELKRVQLLCQAQLAKMLLVTIQKELASNTTIDVEHEMKPRSEDDAVN